MNIKKLAKIITYIRKHSEHESIWGRFNILEDNNIIESFYLEGVFNKTSNYWKQKGFTNYYIPFFEDNDNFFIIEENTALKAAQSIKNELYYYLGNKKAKILIQVHDKNIKQKTFVL